MNLIFKRTKANTFLTSSLAVAEFLFLVAKGRVDRGVWDVVYLNYHSANVSLKMKAELRQFQTHKTKGCIQADGLVLRKFRIQTRNVGARKVTLIHCLHNAARAVWNRVQNRHA